MHIQFTKDHKVQQHDGKGPEYKAGVVYTFNGHVAETYARKYISRGYAVEVNPEPISVAVPSAPELRADGPTLAEYVAAGYSAEFYPPQGYASKEDPEALAQAQVAAKAKREAEEKAKADADALASVQKSPETPLPPEPPKAGESEKPKGGKKK